MHSGICNDCVHSPVSNVPHKCNVHVNLYCVIKSLFNKRLQSKEVFNSELLDRHYNINHDRINNLSVALSREDGYQLAKQFNIVLNPAVHILLPIE